MVQFNAGVQKTAVVTMSNPSTVGHSYDATLFLLGVDHATSLQSFSLAAGESKSVRFPITMPYGPGTYQVYLDIRSGGEQIVLYDAGSVEITGFVFTVRVTNYDTLQARSDASWQWVPGELPPHDPVLVQLVGDAQWYAYVGSRVKGAYGLPVQQLGPVDGGSWRPMTQSCSFLVPDGTVFWDDYPYLEIWVAAGPCCNGYGWSRAVCDGFGLLFVEKRELTPGCEVVYSLANW